MDEESFAGGDNQNNIDILIYNIYTRLKNISNGDFLNNMIIPEIKEIGKKCKIKKDTIEKIISDTKLSKLVTDIQNILDTKEGLDDSKIKDIINNIQNIIIIPIYNSLEEKIIKKFGKNICIIKCKMNKKKATSSIYKIFKTNNYDLFLQLMFFSCIFFNESLDTNTKDNCNNICKNPSIEPCDWTHFYDKLLKSQPKTSSSPEQNINKSSELQSETSSSPEQRNNHNIILSPGNKVNLTCWQTGGNNILQQIKFNPINHIRNIKYIEFNDIYGIFLDHIIQIKKIININNKKYFQIYVYNYYDYIDADLIINNCYFI